MQVRIWPNGVVKSQGAIDKISSKIAKSHVSGIRSECHQWIFCYASRWKIELSSNLHEETQFGESAELANNRETSNAADDHIPQSEMDAIMGPEGTLPWYSEPMNTSPQAQQDDPMAIASALHASPEEDIKLEEIPETIKAEMKQSGAITVSLKYVRNRIVKDRQEWKIALEAELQSLRDTGAIEVVTHVPRGKQVLPMKAVLTLKPILGVKTKKKKRESASAEIFRRKRMANPIIRQMSI